MDDRITAEISLLRSSVLPEEFAWTATVSDDARRHWERDEAVDDRGPVVPPSPLPDFSLRLDDTDAHLRIQYLKPQPEAFTATVSAPSMSRERQAELNAELKLRQAEIDDSVEYPVFTLFTAIREWVASHPLAAAAIPPPRQLGPAHPQRLCLKEVLIWSHHLLATGKRKNIIQWATELEIWGISKPGYPGLVFLEGISDSVDEFVYRIKQLNWKALQIRYEAEQPTPSCPENLDMSQRRSGILQRAKLAGVVGPAGRAGAIEVHTMAEVGRLMREAGLENVFLTSLKISK